MPQPVFPKTRDLPDSILRKVFDGCLNIIYPESCFLCETPLARSRDCGVCSRCWEKFQALRIEPPFCPSCGLPLPNFSADAYHLCGNCIRQLPPYSGARSFGYYSAEARQIIHGFKFDGRRNLVGLLTPLLSEVFADSWLRTDFECITAVPLHARRRRERGFNQSELLAQGLARHIAIPYKTLLKRIRHTPPQVGLTDAQRKENIRSAFMCRNHRETAGRKILLIDDVMTTGATVAGAALTLMNAGAASVSILTVARAVR